MEVYIVGEYREQFPSKVDGTNFNPHPNFSDITDIQTACEQAGILCRYFGGVQELVHAVDKKEKFSPDILFMNISDGLTQPYCRLQAPVLLEMLEVKYTGSSPFTVGLMNNKYYTKMALKKAAIKEVQLPADIYVDDASSISESSLKQLEYPVIVKPNNDGSSIGIDNHSVVYHFSEVWDRLALLSCDYEEMIIEQYIPGTDVSVFLVGNGSEIHINEVIIYKTYDSFHQENTVRGMSVKANKLSSRYPAASYLPQELLQKLRNVSAEIFRVLNVRDIARIDYRISGQKDIFFLEINANPGLSAKADLRAVCEGARITYSDFVRIYIQTALARYQS